MFHHAAELALALGFLAALLLPLPYALKAGVLGVGVPTCFIGQLFVGEPLKEWLLHGVFCGLGGLGGMVARLPIEIVAAFRSKKSR